MSPSGRLLLAAPMGIEARLVRWGAPEAYVHRTGMGPRNAAAAARKLRRMPGDALLVIGFCGALERGLRPGEIVIADRVYAADDEGHQQVSVTCPNAERLAQALAESGLSARVSPVVCVGRLALGERREQLAKAGATAVDMESVWLTGGAGERPFGVVRIVLDTPERELFRPQMVPFALRAGSALRRTASALQRQVSRHGLHTLWSGVPLTGGSGQTSGGESER
jgi:4-hydroxy-3-methylbut-2-en-1-yl diphosphate reductase